METRTVASARSDRGELVLRRRSDGALELRVNGVFVMDSVETTSERELARAALAVVLPAAPSGEPPSGERADGRNGVRVFVGGLGLGYTVAQVLEEPEVTEVHVAEIEPELIAWHRTGLIDVAALDLDDPRLRISCGDVAEILAAQAEQSQDLILLDVDNGPGFLVYESNRRLYGDAFLARCRARARHGGVTVIWSAAYPAELVEGVRDVFGNVEAVPIDVRLGRRRETYWLVAGRG